MSRMADLDAGLQDLAKRLVAEGAAVLPEAYDKACGVPAEIIRNGASSFAEEWYAEASAVIVAVLRELDAEVGRRLMAGEDHVDLAQLITYVEGGQVDVQ